MFSLSMSQNTPDVRRDADSAGFLSVACAATWAHCPLLRCKSLGQRHARAYYNKGTAGIDSVRAHCAVAGLHSNHATSWISKRTLLPTTRLTQTQRALINEFAQQRCAAMLGSYEEP